MNKLTEVTKRDIQDLFNCGITLPDANRTGVKHRLDDLEDFLAQQQTPVTDYDEGLARRLIEQITVYDDHLAFEFKCGLETEVQM